MISRELELLGMTRLVEIRLFFILVLSMLVAPIVAAAQPPGETGADREGPTSAPAPADTWAVQSNEAAQARARRLFGLTEGEHMRVTGRFTPVDENTPVLGKRFAGRHVWTVAISDLNLELPSAPAGSWDRLGPRVFLVLIDAENARLLGILSRVAEAAESCTPGPGSFARPTPERDRPSLWDADRGFGPPNGDPEVSFLAALDAIAKERGVNPYEAVGFRAEYVMRPVGDAGPRPVWVVTLGWLPIAAEPGGEAPDVPERGQHIIDARTGKWLGFEPATAPNLDSKEQNQRTRDTKIHSLFVETDR